MVDYFAENVLQLEAERERERRAPYIHGAFTQSDVAILGEMLRLI